MDLSVLKSGVELATEILRRSNNNESQKYINEYIEAEKALLKERSKPLKDQYDNIIEFYESKLKILFNAAHTQYLRNK